MVNCTSSLEQTKAEACEHKDPAIISPGGLFVAVEGIHGSGKTTVVGHLSHVLRDRGHSVVQTREISGGVYGNAIRGILDTIEEKEEDAKASLLLVLAARAVHVNRLIRPSLARGSIVITDRFAPSTFVYQYYCARQTSQEQENVSLDDVKQLNDFATGGLVPIVTIVLDLPVDVALRRKIESESFGRWEQRSVEYHQRAREAYRHFAQQEHWAVIDADRSLEMVLEDAEKLVLSLPPFVCRT